LLELRAAVLQEAGHAVFTTTNLEVALARIHRRECDVLLLCYSISTEWRDELTRSFRHYCPDGCIVAVTNRPVCELPKVVDRLVYGVDGPEALIEAVQGRRAA
jgi:DNA-binding response OmpR family regulator